MTPEQVRHARDLLTRPENTVSSIGRLLGARRSTIYKYVPELAMGRPIVEQPTARAELKADSAAYLAAGVTLVDGTPFRARLLEPWTPREAPPLTPLLRDRTVAGCEAEAAGRPIAEL